MFTRYICDAILDFSKGGGANDDELFVRLFLRAVKQKYAKIFAQVGLSSSFHAASCSIQNMKFELSLRT